MKKITYEQLEKYFGNDIMMEEVLRDLTAILNKEWDIDKARKEVLEYCEE